MKTRILSLFLCVLMLVSMVPVSVSAEDAVAQIGTKTYPTLAQAIEAANNVGGASITLLKDVELGEKLTITGDVTITGAKTITRAGGYTGTLFTVNVGAKLTLDGNLVIDGGNNWTFNSEKYNDALARKITGVTWADIVASEENSPVLSAAMFDVSGAVDAKNVTIQNSFATKESNGGDASIFKVNADASLTMNGAKIAHVATGGANSVAHLSTNSIWTINAGTLITDTFAGRNGGVCRNDSGMIVMNGGSIERNNSINTNGTVFMMYMGAFEMNGGTICSNTGISGTENGRCSAIYLHNSGKATMNGGVICHNTGISYGGIDTNKTSSELTINGGSVIENVSVLGNTNKDVNMYANTIIKGGTFTQDVSAWCAIGYTAVYDKTLGVYKIDHPYVAEYNGKQYFTLQEAFDAVRKNGDVGTVKVLRDHEVDVNALQYNLYPIVVNVSKLTLDLNGKTVTFDYSKKTISNDTWAAIGIHNGGVLTIIDSSAEQTGMLYNKGAISNSPRIVWVTSKSSLVIEGGRFISEQADTMFYTSNSNTEIPTTLYVKGGYFEHTILTDGGTYDYFNQQDNYEKQIIELTGGTFKHDPKAGRQNSWEVTVPENYTVFENSDGTWTVKKVVSIFFNVSVADSTIVVKTKAGQVVTANPDGSYSLYAGDVYTYTASKEGYITKTDNVSVAENGTIQITLNEVHKHDVSAEWTSDATSHWHTCSGCEEKFELAEHTFEKGVCTICDAEEEGYVAPPTFDYVLFALAARYAQRFDVLVSAENATVTGDMTIKYKRSGTVDIAVAEGYQLVDVIANGQSLGAVTSVTFKKVMAPQTLVVVTEPIPTEEPAEETPAA